MYEITKASECRAISIDWTDNGTFIRPGHARAREGYSPDLNECFVFNEYVDFQKWMKKWWNDNKEIGA